MANKVIIFDIASKLAHFRKINTNSSSLTYLVPPRTTLLGIIGAMLGRERDSYYSDKNFMSLNVAVIPLSLNRTITQGVNYLFIESNKHLSNSNKHTQVPVEYLVSDKLVSYRVILSGNELLIQEIKEKLISENYVYSLSLGPAYCLADIEYKGEYECLKIDTSDFIDIRSVVDKSSVEKIEFSTNIYKEIMPYTFDKGRVVTTKGYIFSKDYNTISLKIKSGQVFSVNIDGKKEYFSYM